jgi:dihydroorotate dehydrogenase (fumarate)
MYATELIDGLVGWMSRKGFSTLAEARGVLSVPAGADESAQERAGYVTALRAADLGTGQW